jgi:hypothetical protein
MANTRIPVGSKQRTIVDDGITHVALESFDLTKDEGPRFLIERVMDS